MSDGILGIDHSAECDRAVAPRVEVREITTMDSPSQDRDAGSNPAGATTYNFSTLVESRGVAVARLGWPACTRHGSQRNDYAALPPLASVHRPRAKARDLSP